MRKSTKTPIPHPGTRWGFGKNLGQISNVSLNQNVTKVGTTMETSKNILPFVSEYRRYSETNGRKGSPSVPNLKKHSDELMALDKKISFCCA